MSTRSIWTLFPREDTHTSATTHRVRVDFEDILAEFVQTDFSRILHLAERIKIENEMKG